MTNEQLQQLTERLSLHYFHQPFRHQAVFNRRLRTTGGRYHLTDHHIDINPLMLEEFDEQNLERVILHELCHYHLHLAGRGYRHRDHDFKTLLKAVGGSRYAPLTSTAAQQKTPRYRYRCQGCGVILLRQRRFNVYRYHCARCGGRFRLEKTRKVKK
ncbi:SprT family protein [uncultured Limosilactobacillus sp.]|uniref:SprT family protein n=1 Tax=uncultured Limosilactobacillus sp. TaxID=2837629 RepID=UPI0025FEEAFD|nr:SprT family protein [uncultured Limosilactobacillus sp.]